MELLETSALSHEIEKLISCSRKFTIIVSPYIKINKRLKPKLSECFKANDKNIILYRENLSSETYNWLSDFNNVELIPISNLHAKCYLNENTGIITSMNLYEYSQINNHEIGVKLTLDQDKNALIDLLKIIELIIKTDFKDFKFSNPVTYKYLNKKALASEA